MAYFAKIFHFWKYFCAFCKKKKKKKKKKIGNNKKLGKSALGIGATACVILSGAELLLRLTAICRRQPMQKREGRRQLVAPTEAGSPNGTNDLFYNKCYFYEKKSIKT